MMNVCSIGGGAFTKLPYEVINCKLSMMRKKPRAKKKATDEVATLGFGGSRKEKEVWQCARSCGACCKLDKGPTFPRPEEIFDDDPVHLQLYKSMIGPDGWCIHYEHTTLMCSIYSDRPYFCRVEPDVFQTLYGISERRFNKEACSSCKDTITAIYGASSEELKNFNRTIRAPSNHWSWFDLQFCSMTESSIAIVHPMKDEDMEFANAWVKRSKAMNCCLRNQSGNFICF